ncbi:VOC family protein [Mesobacillus jeotgali]|uniref:VOC family protein n=1 Tax=Mesobacillus jeotgali TaxID=129985 RepID=UPI0009A778DC|nr:VOC family protein [Mesobacillus jeotgali]
MEFHHIGIEVGNLQASQVFYKNILGFQYSETIRFGKEDIIFLEKGGFKIELFQQKSDSASRERIHFCFRVNNLDKKIKEMKEHNMFPVEGPYFLDSKKIVFYEGLDNELIEFLEIQG